LVQALHGGDPSKLLHLQRGLSGTSDDSENTNTPSGTDGTNLDSLFEAAVNEWVTESPDPKNRRETAFTKILSRQIETETGFNSHAEAYLNYCSSSSNLQRQCRPDILFWDLSSTSKEPPSRGTAATAEARPLALIEVGRNNSEWWMKLDQNSKYLDAMLKQKQKNPLLRFVEPLLFAVLTLEGEGNDDESSSSFRAKLGVFLCVPKNDREDYRMALLWRVSPCSLQEASNAFGRFLRVTSSFAEWRKNKKEVGYQYLSSSCCRVGDDQVSRFKILSCPQATGFFSLTLLLSHAVICFIYLFIYFSIHLRMVANGDRHQVLRSYDSRVRPTNRSPEIYRDTQCQDIVGGEVTVVLEVPAGNEETDKETDVETANKCSSNEEDTFWVDSSERRLLIIGIPYKKGSHWAKKPKDFIPIIEQLQKLHDAGYVHGDIRAFNMVFAGSHGGLIDFDFGGKAEEKTYPEGYRKYLADGRRIGSGESRIGSSKDEDPDNKLAFWHDWYALGHVIFSIHTLVPSPDNNNDAKRLRVFDAERQWTSKQVPPFTDAIQNLKKLLAEIEEKNWSVRPSLRFQKELDKLSS
jgi:hypothetical protein